MIAKDVLALAWERELIVLEDILRPALFVPETKGKTLEEIERRVAALPA